MILKEKGAYIFKNEDNYIYLYIYKKLENKNLSEALPISYNKNPELNYLVAIFDQDGRDFLSQANYKSIEENISQLNMIDLINNSYQELTNIFENLTEDEYKYKLDFAITQLN